ncbi:hypothetical protein [Mycolicibacterium lutetiense]
MRILELDQVVTAVRRDEAEMTAREHVAANITTAIAGSPRTPSTTA